MTTYEELAAETGARHLFFATPKRAIALEAVQQAYNGRTGCACGCRGDYARPEDAPRKVASRVNKVNRNLDDALVMVWSAEDALAEVVVSRAGDGTPTRVVRVYFTPPADLGDLEAVCTSEESVELA